MGHFFTPAIRLLSKPDVGSNEEFGDFAYVNTFFVALPAHLGFGCVLLKSELSIILCILSLFDVDFKTPLASFKFNLNSGT